MFIRSVNDKEFIDKTISIKPETIFHSAAYKHVSLVEQNIIEGNKNNVWYHKILNSSVLNKVLISCLYQLIKQ